MAAPKYRASLDDESKGLIYEGASLSQLSAIFRKDIRNVTRKLHGVMPIGKREGHAIYDLAEAARYLVVPPGDIEAVVKKMSPADLPKELSKDFWAAMKSKQDFEERAGDLWPTYMVIEAFGEIVQLVRMSSRLVVDGVERRTELTDKQREIVNSLVEGMMNELRQKIEETFGPDGKYGNAEDDDETL